MMALKSRAKKLARWVPLALLPALFACDDEGLTPPTAVDDMLARYVALGNSITAGVQSGGINKSLQQAAYPVLLAQQFGLELGSEFNAPFLTDPGCPPPYTDIFTLERVNDLPDDFCLFREGPAPEFLSNVAVPGAAVLDVISNSGAGTGPNTLTQLILGGRTQVEAAAAADPSFVSVWIGSNEILTAGLSGNASLATSVSEFTTRYNSMMTEVDALGAEGGVLIGVGNVTFVPFLSPGVAYLVAAQSGALPPTFNVDLSCAPAALGGIGDQVLVPFGYGFGVLLATALQGVPVTLNCATDPPVLSQAEIVDLVTKVTAFNQVIEAAATERGWAYVDPNVTFAALKAAGEIPLFPDPSTPSAPFGKWFSLDGVHPSSAAHVLVANEVISAINDTYSLTIATLPAP